MGYPWGPPPQFSIITPYQWFYYLRQKKKTDNDVEIVKIVNVFKKIWTIAILMRKDVPNPEKLVWGPYD